MSRSDQRSRPGGTFVALALLSGLACAQTDSAPTERNRPVPPPAETATSRARELLDSAARFQRGDLPRARPTTLHGRFYVGVRDEQGSLVRASVERWYTRDPERMLTTRSESVTESTSTVGWNQGVAWFHDQRTGQVVVYSDEPELFDVDLELLREQLRLTRLMLDAAVLDAMIPKLVDLRVAGSGEIVDLDGGSHAVERVTARLPDELFGLPLGGPPPAPGDPPPMLELELAVDAETGTLWSLRVRAPHRPELSALDLRFDFHAASPGGLVVPGNVRVYREGETRESVTLGVALDEQDRLLFEVDEPLDLGLFEPPSR
jgi:hypothetical protein